MSVSSGRGARPLHVVVDAHNLVDDERGIGRYVRAVLRRALRAPDIRWTLYVRRFFLRAAPFSHALEGSDGTGKCRIPGDADVVWWPWNGTFAHPAVPAVATIHDAGPFAFPAPNQRQRRAEQAPFLRTAQTAARVLVQSEFTAREVVRRLGIARAKIVVTPLAADACFSAGAPVGLPAGVNRPYLLYVGAHDARKNVETLFAAFAQAFPRGELTLVLTHPPARPLAHTLVIERTSDAELVALYRAATFVVAPSAYEGFGLPVLEALACAVPVLAARGGALPEVAGAAVAWVDEPLDVAAWSAALRSFACDDARRARLAALGPAQAAHFSWERCAAQTVAVLREVAALKAP